jgi:hypothetical protein
MTGALLAWRIGCCVGSISPMRVTKMPLQTRMHLFKPLLRRSTAMLRSRAGATARILLGHATDGLTQLEEARSWTSEADFLYLDRLMTGGIAAAYVLTGRLKEGVALLERTIDASDKDGDQGNACWNRIFLAEIYAEILASRQKVALGVLLKNFRAILRVKLFGARLARALLEEAGRHPQLHDQGSFRARVDMNLGLLHKITKERGLARQYLERARGPAELQGADLMVGKIDAALAELRH